MAQFRCCKIVFAFLCGLGLSACAPPDRRSVSPDSTAVWPIAVLDTARLRRDYHNWAAACGESESQASKIVNIHLARYVQYDLPEVSPRIVVCEIHAVDGLLPKVVKADRWLVYALYATNQLEIFDTGFYDPDCDTLPNPRIGRVTALRLSRRPLLVVEEVCEPKFAMDVPVRQASRSYFFNADAGFRRVLTLETAYIDYNITEYGESFTIGPATIRSRYFHTDAGDNTLKCWVVNLSRSASADYEYYCWNSDTTSLALYIPRPEGVSDTSEGGLTKR
jgi:hypothetical protein